MEPTGSTSVRYTTLTIAIQNTCTVEACQTAAAAPARTKQQTSNSTWQQQHVHCIAAGHTLPHIKRSTKLPTDPYQGTQQLPLCQHHTTNTASTISASNISLAWRPSYILCATHACDLRLYTPVGLTYGASSTSTTLLLICVAHASFSADQAEDGACLLRHEE